MNFDLVRSLTQTFIDTIQGTARQVVIELKKHTYNVTVSNPQTKVEVQGKVEVDQTGTQKQLKDVSLALRELRSALKPLKEVKINNFPKQSPLPKIPEFPKQIEISNMTKEVDVNVIVNALGQVEKAVSQLKLDPTIKVDAPTVNIPAPIVNLPPQKAPIVHVDAPDLSIITDIITFLNELGPKNPLPVQLSDGKKFYTALQQMADIYAGSNTSSFQDSSGHDGRAILNQNNEIQVTMSDTWSLNDLSVVGSVTYLGEETVDRKWRVKQITTNGDFKILRYATPRNNPLVSSYQAAWDTYLDLVYDIASKSL